MCHLHDHALCGGQEAKIVDLSKMDRRRIVQGFASGTLLALAACETNPVTGRQQFTAFAPNDAQLAQMALSAWTDQKSKEKVSTDPQANARLQRVGQKVAAVSGLPNQQWEFVVFDKPDLNAFVLPGGKVGFYKGLLDMAQSDDQIAVVLGHEVGHVQGRHAAERYSQQTAGQLIVAGGTAVAASRTNDSQKAQALQTVFALGAQGLLLKYSRDQELEADAIGVDNMHRAGYNVRQSIAFWEMMAQRAPARGPTFLSTHPGPDQRIERLRAYIAQRGYA